MRRKLHLVKGFERDFDARVSPEEDRFQYPVPEEPWEVSCEPDRIDPEQPPLSRDSRRAS